MLSGRRDFTIFALFFDRLFFLGIFSFFFFSLLDSSCLHLFTKM